MAIDPDKLLNRDFGSVRETYSEKDCILYVLFPKDSAGSVKDFEVFYCVITA